jgi:hypothetical protein
VVETLIELSDFLDRKRNAEVGREDINTNRSRKGKEVINVRKIIMILGILIVTTILISGSAVASTHHAVSQNNIYCTNPNNAVGGEDDTWATLGVNLPYPILGVINLSMNDSYLIQGGTDFTSVRSRKSYWKY